MKSTNDSLIKRTLMIPKEYTVGLTVLRNRDD